MAIVVYMYVQRQYFPLLSFFTSIQWTYVSGLAILFGIIQFVAIGVYAVTLIPYATTLIKTGVTKLTSLATSS